MNFFIYFMCRLIRSQSRIRYRQKRRKYIAAKRRRQRTYTHR